jgi:hypothetical protein
VDTDAYVNTLGLLFVTIVLRLDACINLVLTVSTSPRRRACARVLIHAIVACRTILAWRRKAVVVVYFAVKPAPSSSAHAAVAKDTVKARALVKTRI